MHHVNETVSYGVYGVCRIDDIVTKDFDGKKKRIIMYSSLFTMHLRRFLCQPAMRIWLKKCALYSPKTILTKYYAIWMTMQQSGRQTGTSVRRIGPPLYPRGTPWNWCK